MDASLPSPGSSLRGLIEEFCEDQALAARRWPLAASQAHREARRRILASQQQAWEGLEFDALAQDGRADWMLMSILLAKELALLDRADEEAQEALAAAPFLPQVVALEEDRMDRRWTSGPDGAERIAAAVRQMGEAAARIEEKPPTSLQTLLAGRAIKEAGEALAKWEAFHLPYSPEHAFWCRAPLDELKEGLGRFAEALIRRGYGVEPEEADDVIVGRPIGREALMAELARDLILHTPEELIGLARQEMAWCTARAEEAAEEMGFGRDWRRAQEQVKQAWLAPGGQHAVVGDMAEEADALVGKDWVTVPPLCSQGWQMTMMPRERQKVAPFFLGGETIYVSQPTHDMSHAEKLMSARGNNPDFSRATVQHELIPGHHLQFYAVQRRRPYRQAFSTPFWIEGWTMHWEFFLWGQGFPQTPAQRLGMLFWRMHRCARVSFSLRYHLGELSAEEAVAMLVDDVGHEPATAKGEVRRSLGPDYPAAYQCAYLLGGMQVHALWRERKAATWTDRAFHDRFLDESMMPIELLALVMRGAEIPRQLRPANPLLDQWQPGGHW